MRGVMDEQLRKTLIEVARYYDERKVGEVGPLGFRRSTDLNVLFACLDQLIDEKIIIPNETRFLDLGCADGRVNLFLSYLTDRSVGIELDEWTLDEYARLRFEVVTVLREKELLMPKENIFLYHGDSLDDATYKKTARETGLGFEDFDVYYTFLVMHDEFAELVAQKAKKGSIFITYGLNRVFPKHQGLTFLKHLSPMQDALAIYQKS